MTVIENIETILKWYYDKGPGSPIDVLLDERDRLAIWAVKLAAETADSFQEYNTAYFVRKINTSRKINNLVRSKMAVNKAEHEAIEELADIWEKEKEDEANAHRNDLMLRQVNKVLEAMNQRIAYEKEEKRNANYQT